MSSDVKVGIKLRPLIEREKDENLSTQWIVKGNSIVSSDEETKNCKENGFHFDHIFDESATNSHIFDSIVKPIVDAAIDGFNGTIFCYGQFNSGKTYTITGTPKDPGIIPHTIHYIFNAISNSVEREYLLRVSCLEVYNEKVRDLLSKSNINLELYKDDKGEIIVNCKEEITNSANSMLSIMKKGIKNKKISESDRNERIISHSLFRIIIESQNVDGDEKETVQVSQINFVDLAGFEKIHCADAHEDRRTDVSLSTLESRLKQLNKLENLHEHSDSYSSKLTDVLQSSLGDNAVLAIICTVTSVALEETHYTLLFASQVNNMKTTPLRNKVGSDAALLIRYAKQLMKLQTELEKMRNDDTCIEPEELESNNSQKKYHINYLLEERIKLLKSQIISGCATNYERSHKYKSRRRQLCYNPGTFKQYLPVHYSKNDLPTIIEISPEKPYTKGIIQSVGVINKKFQTAFTDFELDLIGCEAVLGGEENNAMQSEHVDCTETELHVGFINNNCFLTPEKQDSCVQTSSNHASPTTPKSVLRNYILDLTKDLSELREFTTLEKQLMCKGNHCCAHSSEEETARQFICPSLKSDEIDKYSSPLIAELEDEKVKLTDDLELKIHELSEIKKDIRSLKLDIEKLEETIYLLTNENMEMSTKLSAEKERSKEAETNLQKVIHDLYERISMVTDEKINVESEIAVLSDQLESFRLKVSDGYKDDTLFVAYQSKIDALKTENIELSAIIAERNEELESIKESKSLLYDHECVYKDEIAIFKEKNEFLVTENNKLSTDLMDKIEENDMLTEQCNILKNKMSLIENTHSDENDMDQLRSENNILKAEIMELKMRITILSDENTKFSHDLLETMEDLDNTRNEKPSNYTLNLSVGPAGLTNEEPTKLLEKENYEELAKKVTTLQEKVNHLSRLNQKLSDLKLSSCSQCAHLKNANENRRTLKLEAKILNHKLEDLQKKFDQKCADTEALKLKANQDLNLSFADISMNASFADGMNVSFVEEKVQHLNNEMQVLKNNHNKLSILYEEKCNEVEKLHDEAVDAKNTDDGPKHVLKNETRIEKIQKSIDQVKDDIDELKKNNTNFASVLSKFRTEKTNLLDEINVLKSTNEELQQKMTDKEISVATNIERAQLLETEVLNMSKEIEQYSIKEKIIQSEKLTLEVKLEDLHAEKESQDVLIIGLHKTIDDLNECISSLKNELDSVTNQKNELTFSTEVIEHKYKDELEVLRQECNELEKERQGRAESERRATLWAKELETDVEKLQNDLERQESLYKELQKKILQLENLLEERQNENETLKEKLQAFEVQLVDSKDSTAIEYKNTFESIVRESEESTKESEIKFNKINETLNKCIEENDHLPQELLQELIKLRDIEIKFKNLQDQDDPALIVTNKKLMKELNVVKECMINELKSLKSKVNSEDFLNKTADEIFIIFLQMIMSKEEEVTKKMRDLFERDKQKLVDDVRQSADAEKRVTLWAKELEGEIEKLQMDLTTKEHVCKEEQDKLRQLEHLLKESEYEKEMLKEKMIALETDFNTLQSEFDKHSKVDIYQKEEAVIVAQKREREMQEAFKNKEIELQTKIKSDKEIFEKRIEELICTAENYKIKNMELKSNIEDYEANEKQLRNIIEANNSELKTNSQTIHKMSLDLEQLTEDYNEISHEVDEKTSRIENITTLLKNKCDMLSEYKAKLETIMPDYEMLNNQVKERKESIERYKEEIEQLKMERDQQIVTIKDKLDSKEIENVGLNKQLNELNNKNAALMEELDNLKEKYEELQRMNAKLERKIRNSTSKVKAEEEMDELRDVNKRLQNNLEGASNRITELQEGKNKILKELVNLKGQYDLLNQENVEIKRTLSTYKSKQNVLCCLSEGDSKYDTLIQEKNKIALELEGKKLLLNQKGKEINEYINELRDLTIKNEEFDNQLKQYVAVICERDLEISDLKHKLHVKQCENKLVNALEAKLKIVEQENKKLDDELQTFKAKSQINMKQVDKKKLSNEKVYSALQKEKSELQTRLNDYENKLELKSNSSSSRSASPAFENNRRRRSRNEMFNQRRQLECVTLDIDDNENDETSEILRKKIHELELQLVSKNGQIAALEIQIQSENFPYQKKCKELEELLLTLRKKNSEIKSETRKLQRTLNDINAWECDTCRHWRNNKREQSCQTTPTNMRAPLNMNNGIVGGQERVMKLEKEKAIIKDVCRARCRQVKDLEDKVRELELTQTTSFTKRIEFLQQGASAPRYTTAMHFNKHLDFEKNRKSAMKENVPANVLDFTKRSNYRDTIWSN